MVRLRQSPTTSRPPPSSPRPSPPLRRRERPCVSRRAWVPGRRARWAAPWEPSRTRRRARCTRRRAWRAPVAPLAPPLGGVFSPFTGAAGQLGAGGGVAPLLVGILALLTVSLARRDFRTYLIECEMPKPSSALLRPLERPG